MLGISIQLHESSIYVRNITNIYALWWDSPEPLDLDQVRGKALNLATNDLGFVYLDLSEVTSLSLGQTGYLLLYKPYKNYKDNLVFCGELTVEDIPSGQKMYSTAAKWVRPASWPDISLPEGEPNCIKATIAVLESDIQEYTRCQLYMYAYAGVDGTVDWGDGIQEEFGNSSSAYLSHAYNYDSFSGPITDNYKIAEITIIMSRVVSLSFTTYHKSGAYTDYPTGLATPQNYLEILIRANDLESPSFTGTYGYLGMLERVYIDSPELRSPSLSGLRKLKSVEIVQTDADNLSTYNRSFASCVNLIEFSVPSPFNLATLQSFCLDCVSLKEVDLELETKTVSYAMKGSFNNCVSIESIRIVNAPVSNLVTFLTDFVKDCGRLRDLTLIFRQTTAVTYAGLDIPTSLQYLDIKGLGTMTFDDYALNNNTLKTIADMSENPEDIVSTNLLDAADRSTLLTRLPVINNTANTQAILVNCYSLQVVPPYDLSSRTATSTVIAGLSLKRVLCTMSVNSNLVFIGCNLTTAAINEIFQNLPDLTSLPARSINITTNPGFLSADYSTAQAKNWIVTGA